MWEWIELIRADPVVCALAIIIISVALLFTTKIFKQSSVVSFLLVGLLVGPFCMNLLPQGLTTSSHLGELAISFLLFVIGLELDSSIISWKDRRRITMGVYQVIMGGVFLSGLFLFYHYSLFNSLRLGLLCAMSSTAVVLKVLEERNDSHSPYAINATTILIVQDLFAVLLMAIMALPADMNDSTKLLEAGVDVLKILLFVPALYISARYVLPKVLRKINKKTQPELFMFSLLIVVLGASSLGHYLCNSAGMGAFIAGFALASSPMAYQIRADIDPFKQVLLSVFFMMIGASFNIFIFQTHWGVILVALLLIPLMKTISTMIAMILTKNEIVSSFRTSMALSQIGEFSLLLAVIANKTGWLDDNFTQTIFALAIITMGFTPVFINFAHSTFVHKILNKFSLPENMLNQKCDLPTQAVIIGYGIAGQSCADVLDQMGVRYSVIDQNTKTIEKLKTKNLKAIYGDASRHEILHAAGVEEAKWLVIAVPSSVDRLTVTCEARVMNAKIDIIVRSHFIKEKTFLEEVGANQVISEEEAVSSALSDLLKDRLTLVAPATAPEG